jgi:hypothetical protein
MNMRRRLMPSQRSSPQKPERWRLLFMYFLIAFGLAMLTISVFFIGYEAGRVEGIMFNAEAYFQGHCGFMPPLK